MVGLMRRKRNKISETPLHLMLIPSLVVIVVYQYLPMYGVIIAFQKFNPMVGLFGPQQWVGWENLTFFFKMPNAERVIFNTLFISSMKIVVGIVVPLTVALLLNELGSPLVKRSIQTMIYLPHFLSWVILGGILVTILSPSNGIVNRFLGLFGVEPIFFLGSNRWFPFTIVITDAWKDFGWGTIIYLAALSGVDENLYEAAIIDGANRVQQTRHITIPGISHIVVLLMVLSLGKVLNAGFGQIFNLYSPLVYESGDIIDTLVYRIGLVQAQFSLSAAIGLFKGFVSLILISASYVVAYKTTGYRIF